MSDRDLEPLPPEIAQLLDHERARTAPDSAERMRVLSRVHGTLGLIGAGGGGAAGGGAGTDTAPPPATGGTAAASTAALAGRPLATALAGFVLGTIVGAAGYARLAPATPVHDDLDLSQQVATSVMEPLPAPVEPPPVAASAPEPTTGASAAQAPSARPSNGAAPAPSASGDGQGRDVDLAAERALLEIARTALARGQSGRALEALQRHATEFPRGRLGEEREALWIQSLRAAGREDEARARAERFAKAYPKSLLLPAIEGARRQPDGALPPKR